MTPSEQKPLTILIADEDEAALSRLRAVLEDLGHEVVPHAVSTAEACALIEREDPDLSIVMLHRDDDHALDLISECVQHCSGPVLAKVDEEDLDFISRAAEIGISAYTSSQKPHELQGAIEVSVRRHREKTDLEDKVGQLETALERKTTIERAKGILMERHGLDERDAFEALRGHARSQRTRVVDVARAVADGTASPSLD
jgi:AmiR/NasT family two-component response regulator